MTSLEKVSCCSIQPISKSIIHSRRITLWHSTSWILQPSFCIESSKLFTLFTCLTSYFTNTLIIHNRKCQRFLSLLSQEFIFIFFMYQVEGHRSTKTRHTYHYLITCITTFKTRHAYYHLVTCTKPFK